MNLWRGFTGEDQRLDEVFARRAFFKKDFRARRGANGPKPFNDAAKNSLNVGRNGVIPCKNECSHRKGCKAGGQLF